MDTMPIFDKGVLLDSLGDDPDLIKEIVDSYMQALPGDIEKLEVAVERNNRDQVIQCAHNIKGAASNIGGKRVSLIAGEIEDEARKGSIEVCRSKIKSLKTQFVSLEKIVDQQTWK